MNVLVLGSGGREHALCHTISKSSRVDNLYAMPGNPGIREVAVCVDSDPFDHLKLKEFVNIYKIDLIIPGSEVHLESGVTDLFFNTPTKVFGPTNKAVRIESSKEFAKDLMAKHNIPTARYRAFEDYKNAVDYVRENGTPIVIKYDGLAGGKGVVVAKTLDEAIDSLKLMLVDKRYGDSKVIIEEYLEGPEFSLMCFVDGNKIIPMPIAQDHKRLYDNDLGPNTGGMGIYSSVPIIPDEVVEETLETIIKPTIEALIKEDSSFTGFLYGGLMLTKSGPKVIEFNARFGDPEAEVILPKLESDIIDIIDGLYNDVITEVKWNNTYYVGVVMASKGYPKEYQKGYSIKGLKDTSSIVYHMGTREENDVLLTNGGRVLLVTGNGETIEKAIDNAYDNVSKIECKNLIYRNDIGNKSVKR